MAKAKVTSPAAKAAAKPNAKANGKAAPAKVNGNGKVAATKAAVAAKVVAAKPEADKPVQSPMPVLCAKCQKQMGSDWEIKPIVSPERSEAAKRAWVTIRANREKAAAEAAAQAATLAKLAKRGKASSKLIKSKKA